MTRFGDDEVFEDEVRTTALFDETPGEDDDLVDDPMILFEVTSVSNTDQNHDAVNVYSIYDVNWVELDDNGDPVGDIGKDLGERPVLEFVPGQTYKFDMSDSTNGIHPLYLSTTSTYDAATGPW